MINVADIKKQILLQALSGKLVEQRPKEGTGEDFFRLIQQKKQELIKQGKFKKEKNLPAIGVDEIPFETPATWKWIRLGNVLKVINGTSYEKSDVVNAGLRVLRGGNIQNDKLLITNCDVFLPINYLDPNKLIQEGDTIVVASTGSQELIGKPAFVTKSYTNTTIGAFLRICRPFMKEMCAFLGYIFQSSLYKNYIKNKANGTNINNVKESYITELCVPLPPLEEQKRIVKKLDEIFAELDNVEKNQNKFVDIQDKLQSKILKLAIKGKLVEQIVEEGTGEDLLKLIQQEKLELIKQGKIKKEKPLPEIENSEIPFEIPSTWKWTRLGDLGSYKKGPFGSALTKSMFIPKSENSIKVYEQKNAIQKDWKLGTYFIKKSYYESDMKGFTLLPGDIIVSCAGTIGETYVIPSDAEIGIINQALMRMRIMKGIDLDYFLMYFDFILKGTANEKGKGTAIKNIPPFDILKKMVVPLPPLEEQKRIIARINELISYIK